MKDIISLLITSSCLAIAGIGIYFFSYNTDDNSDVNQTSGKKNNGTIKKQVDLENEHDTDDDYYENNIDNDDDYISDNLEYKPKPKQKPKTSNKTKKYKNKFATSKKKYY